MSRARLQALLREGNLEEGGQPASDPSRRVKPGERYRLVVPPPRPGGPAPEERELRVLYEDAHLIVLVKPAGMVVHPAPGHAGGTLVNALLAHCGAACRASAACERPGIVHRLDKEVSGVLVVAKHDRAHIGLAGQFTVHSVERVYEAHRLGRARRRAGHGRPADRPPPAATASAWRWSAPAASGR